MDDRATRRRYLQAFGALGVVGLAGCSSDDTENQSGDGEPAAGATPTPSGGTATASEETATPEPEPKAPAGTEEWAYETGSSRLWSHPALVDGTLYLGGFDGNVYAIDATDGTEQWVFETDSRIHSSPAVVDGTVYIGSTDHNVYALDAADGTKQWAYDTGDRVRSSPTVANGSVYVGNNDLNNNLLALDATDGSREWRYSPSGDVNGAPVVEDGVVYIGSSGGDVAAVGATEGFEEWETQFDEGATAPAVDTDAGTLYVGVEGLGLVALSTSDGSEQWRTEIDDDPLAPATGDGMIFTGDESGKYYGLDQADGTIRWEFREGFDTRVPPVFESGTVYMEGGNVDLDGGLLLGLDAADGTKTMRFETAETVTTKPAVAEDGTVYFGCDDGNVYAFTPP